ncbi:Scavenger mRNA-decapping enzyme DcpS [Beauveria bassiana D1-5]|uniref:Scavenger mRNA-decapping enzyme DcpS n=1 Tax=Beauveria bassiana D1-5 TaxID=1245745 RepID=A0A0A2WGI9_BEABA|nr:Scavenger mRNA-decapping enzyme DcpS [Beauveria bassiana D1-5]
MADDGVDLKAASEAAVAKFQLERVLNQDQAGRRTSMVGTVDGQRALLVVERAPFPTSEAHLGRLPGSLARLQNLGANDVYSWHMARTGADETGGKGEFYPDLKINLIYPCTEAHVKKYSKQGVRFVTETPALYRDKIRPYMQSKREQGRLNWDAAGAAGDEGFLLLPDLNWDRTTLDALHLLALVERRDLWSLRDLKKKHVGWLRHMRAKVTDATVAAYPSIERDQLKLYVHYQPTYYHLHIHIVHAALEAGATQATGKAVGLDSIIETLEVMAGGDEAGMDAVSLTYTLGEASELWTQVYEPLKTAAAAADATTAAGTASPRSKQDR